MDGYLKIKTKIDNSNVDKEIKQLEDKIKKLQTDNSKQSQQQDSLQAEINKYEQMTQKAEEYRQTIKKLEQDKASMMTNNPDLVVSSTPEYTNLNAQLDAIKAKYASTTAEIDKQAPKIDKVYTKLEQVKSKQTENNTKIAEFRHQIEQINMNNIQQGVDNVGKSITNQIGKLGKMAMAVVGVRTAFSAVSRVVNLVKQYNSQVSTDFEYMGYCIANIVAPAVQKLIQLLYTALSYVNAITTAWFGINLFANSSAKSFQKMKSSAKEIQKSLQGFDEMNVLSDSSNVSSNAGIPRMDLSGMQGEVPAWLQWIIDNKDLILSTLAGIAAGIVAIKWGLGGIKALGIGIMVKGIIDLITSLKEYIEDPSWKNFGKVIKAIGEIILGIGIIIGNVPAIVIGAIAIILGAIISNWDKIKQFLQNGIDWLIGKIDWVEENFGLFGKVIYKTFIALLQELLNMFDGIFSGVKTILDGILKVFKGIFTGDMKTVLNGFKQIFKGVFDSLWAIAKAPLNMIIRGINSLIRGANKIKFDVPDWVPGFGGKQFGFNISEIPLLARGTVVSRPTPAIIGESGAEAVVPLENNTEWLEKMADMISSKIGGSGTVNVYLDGRLIQRQIAKKEQQLAFSTNS